MIRIRTLLAAVMASAVLGGSVGALATAATSSQASPQAIAAAVTKVKDTTAEATLERIRRSARQICLNTAPAYGGQGEPPAEKCVTGDE